MANLGSNPQIRRDLRIITQMLTHEQLALLGVCVSRCPDAIQDIVINEMANRQRKRLTYAAKEEE